MSTLEQLIHNTADEDLSSTNYLVMADCIEEMGDREGANRLRKWMEIKNELIKNMRWKKEHELSLYDAVILVSRNIGMIRCLYLRALVCCLLDQEILRKWKIECDILKLSDEEIIEIRQVICLIMVEEELRALISNKNIVVTIYAAYKSVWARVEQIDAKLSLIARKVGSPRIIEMCEVVKLYIGSLLVDSTAKWTRTVGLHVMIDERNKHGIHYNEDNKVRSAQSRMLETADNLLATVKKLKPL